MKALLRYFSLIFHGVLTACMIAISGIALATGPASLRLDLLPWTGSTLTYVVFFGGIFGLATVILAAARKLRWLFFAWSLVAAVLIVKGYISYSYHFEPGGLGNALAFIAAAVVALAGAWPQARTPVMMMKKSY